MQQEYREYVNAYVKIQTYEKKQTAVGSIRKIEGGIMEITPGNKREPTTLPFGLLIQICLHQKGLQEIVWGGEVYRSNDTQLVVHGLKPLDEMENLENICFQLHDTEFSLCVIIVRIIALLDTPIEYCCLFIDVPHREEARICRCLFQIEAMKRRMKVNMVEWQDVPLTFVLPGGKPWIRRLCAVCVSNQSEMYSSIMKQTGADASVCFVMTGGPHRKTCFVYEFIVILKNSV